MDNPQYSDREFATANVIPVDQILGARTLFAARDPRQVDGVILQKTNEYTRGRTIDDFTALTKRRTLNEPQVGDLQNILTDPESYWNGSPKYRRLPPKPDFAFAITGDDSVVHLLVDLQNPGWEFSCGEEAYWGFNFAGPRLAQLAKSLFPEYASPNRGSVWRKGIIKELERELTKAT